MDNKLKKINSSFIQSLIIAFILPIVLRLILDRFIPLSPPISTIVDLWFVLIASSPFILGMVKGNKQLTQNEEKYRSLVEHNSALICEFNLEGKLINANAMLIQATGYSLEELLDKPLHSFVIEKEVAAAEHYFERAKKGELLNFELTFQHKTGKLIELGLKSVPCVIGNQITGIFFIAKDITERKKSLQELNLIKNQLESFIDNASEAICIFNPEGILMQVNQAYEQLFGWEKSELIGNRLPGIPLHLQPSLHDVYQLVQAKEKVRDYETIRYQKDGTIIHVNLSFSGVLDSAGNVIALACFASDITQRKKMEDALSESEEKYRLIAENMSDFIALLDANGSTRYASESHKYIDGFTIDEGSYLYIHPDDRQKGKSFYQRLINEKTALTIVLRVKHIKGYWLTVETNSKPILNAEGEIEGIIIVSRDITERKKAEEILLKSEKLSVAGQLAAGVAHEIRNPLTTLRGFVQLMMTTESSNNIRYLEIMLSELDRINLIVGEFLILSRPHLRQYAVKDLRTIINHVVTLLEPQAVLGNIRMQVHISDGLMLVECEENHLKQVFINLLKNGMEAMPKGGDFYIIVEIKANGMVRLRFIDQGCGIAPEHLPKLGEPFFTTKEKGTGLGMMITYKIIEDHQGKISIRSELEKGTTIDVQLPLYQDQTNVLELKKSV